MPASEVYVPSGRALAVYLAASFTIAYSLQFVALGLPAVERLAVLAAMMYVPFIAAVAALLADRVPVAVGLRSIGVRVPRSWRVMLYPIVIVYSYVALGAVLTYLIDPAGFVKAYTLLSSRQPVLLLALLAIPAGYTVNMILALGEEAGWRGLLYNAFMGRLGFASSTLLIGLIWGLWHAPLVLLAGYDFNLPGEAGGGSPLLLLSFCLFTILLTAILLVLRASSASVLPCAALHGLLNAVAGLLLVLGAGLPRLFRGPAGLVGVASLSVITLLVVLLARRYRGAEA